MADLFSEVEEEVRKERWEQLWKSYGAFIIAGAGAVVLSVAGWQAWERYSAAQLQNASQEFNMAMTAAQTGTMAQAESDFMVFSADAPDGYAKISRFQTVVAQIAQGKRDAAVANLRELADDPNPLLSAPAQLQLAWLLVETSPREEVEAVIAPLIDGESPWRFAAAEVEAYLDLHHGNRQDATAAYQALAINPGVSDGTRQRAGAIAQFLRANSAQADDVAPTEAITELTDQEAPQQ